MAKRLTGILFTIFFVSVFISTILVLIVNQLRITDIGTDQKQIYGTAVLLPFSMAIIFAMTICSTTVYLNLNKPIRENYIASMLSFLLLPSAFAFFIVFSLIKGGIFSRDWLLVCSILIPFLIVLVFHFLKYRKTILVKESID